MTPRTTPTEVNDNKYGLAYGLGRFAWSLGYLRCLSLLAGLRVLGLIVFGSTALFAGTYTDSQNVRYTTTLGTPNTAVVDGSTGVSGAITIPTTINDGTDTYQVISIGNSAFPSRSSMTSVTIPSSVTSIGQFAF